MSDPCSCMTPGLQPLPHFGHCCLRAMPEGADVNTPAEEFCHPDAVTRLREAKG